MIISGRRKLILELSLLMGLIVGVRTLFGSHPLSIEMPNTPSSKHAPTPIPSTVTPVPAHNLEVLIVRLERTMPGIRTEGFHVPDKADESAFKSIVNALMDNDLKTVANIPATVHYEILTNFDSSEGGAESFVLMERQPIEKGWGLFFFRKQSSQNIVIEAPHPIADENTENVALHLYRALHAKTLLIAGAHRDANPDGSADLAHSPHSIFQTIHTVLFHLNGQTQKETIFLQIHGYATDLHPKTPQVVIGYNWKNDPEKDALLSKLVDSLEGNGISVGTCNDDKYRGLCGTSNVQRLATEDGIFIHMELNRTIRSNDFAFVLSLQDALIR